MLLCRLSETAGINVKWARSVQPLNDRAVDREAGAPKRFTTWTGDQAVLYEGEDLELFTYLTPEPLFSMAFLVHSNSWASQYGL